jgi:hypothetical protein
MPSQRPDSRTLAHEEEGWYARAGFWSSGGWPRDMDHPAAAGFPVRRGGHLEAFIDGQALFQRVATLSKRASRLYIALSFCNAAFSPFPKSAGLGTDFAGFLEALEEAGVEVRGFVPAAIAS